MLGRSKKHEKRNGEERGEEVSWV
uniref:Uncharacterized protein n=1 Tax=Rhizophora mucronata TaxID=61149 RepID=A0A2P2IZQ9_RHIMU